MEALEINGVAKQWIRVRIEKGDYGEQGTYTLENEKWVFKDDRPLRPPALRSLTFRYREDYRDVRHVLAFNDFQYTDVTEVARTEYTIFQPFPAKPEESPALYLGFIGEAAERSDRPLLPARGGARARLAADRRGRGRDGRARRSTRRCAGSRGRAASAWSGSTGTAASGSRSPSTTRRSGFTSSGFAFFVAPDDWVISSKFTEERYWLRARLEQGGYVKPPRVQHGRHERDRRVQPRDDPRRDARQLRRLAAAAVQVPARPAARRRGHRGSREAEAERRGDRRSRRRCRCARSSPRTRRTTRCGCATSASRASSRRGRAAATTRSTTSPARCSSATAAAAWCRPRARTRSSRRRTASAAARSATSTPNTLTSLGRALAYIESVHQPAAGERRRRSRDDRGSQGARAVHDQEPRSRGDHRGLRDARAARVDARSRARECVPDRTQPRPRHARARAEGRDRAATS